MKRPVARAVAFALSLLLVTSGISVSAPLDHAGGPRLASTSGSNGIGDPGEYAADSQSLLANQASMIETSNTIYQNGVTIANAARPGRTAGQIARIVFWRDAKNTADPRTPPTNTREAVTSVATGVTKRGVLAVAAASRSVDGQRPTDSVVPIFHAVIVHG